MVPAAPQLLSDVFRSEKSRFCCFAFFSLQTKRTERKKKFRIGFKAKINVAASDSKTPIYLFLPSDVKIGLPFSVGEKLGDGRHRIRDCLILTDQAKDQIKIRLRKANRC